MTKRSISAVLNDIEGFAPENGNWRRLDNFLEELWSIGVTADHLPILFRVFERFPDTDGAGVLWSILHGVESLTLDYEQALKLSIKRQPSLMGKIMLDRLERENAS